MSRKSRYLFRYPHSPNWFLRLQIPAEVREPGEPAEIRRSLKTPDRRLAELEAAKDIEAHRRRLWNAANSRACRHLTRDKEREYPIGKSVLEDGTIRIATEDKVYEISPTGAHREFSNLMVVEFVWDYDPENPDPDLYESYGHNGPNRPKINSKQTARSSDDLAILDRWVKDKQINPHLEREARQAFESFQKVVGGKSLKNCKRSDGIKLVDHYRAQGIKLPTLNKKIGHLRAMVNLAIKHELLVTNPFSGVSPGKIDPTSIKRIPLSEEDVLLVKNNFHSAFKDDQERLIWAICTSTGMRPDEAFEIREEFKEAEHRYVIVGTKTKTSQRRVPIPDALIAFLPDKICGPLFIDQTPVSLLKRVNRRMKALGITDPRKPFYSTRHRAKDRLRAAGCPLDVQYELLGHEEETVARGYGHGSPVAVLKKWIDFIGM